MNKNTYKPDYAIHPGEIIDQYLNAIGMKKIDFAERMELSVKTVSQIINGKEYIAPETALKLERVLGMPAYIWRNIDSSYRIFIAKQKDQEQYAIAQKWVNEYPIKELIRRKYLKQTKNINDLIEQLLAFFSVGSLDILKNQIYNVSFRKSKAFESKTENVLSWLRIGHLEAQRMQTPLFNRDQFISILKEIRKLSVNESINDMLVNIQKRCYECGVVVLYIEEIHNTFVSGAAFWVNKDKPVIMLSSRYKKEDHFWFSFYHECSHIINDSKKELFVDYDGENKEKDANSFASNILIPNKEYDDFIKRYKDEEINSIVVRTFANKLGISPGIIVGRLQKDRVIRYNQLTHLKRTIDFSIIHGDV